jgi:hypothetical protein
MDPVAQVGAGAVDHRDRAAEIIRQRRELLVLAVQVDRKIRIAALDRFGQRALRPAVFRYRSRTSSRQSRRASSATSGGAASRTQ